MTGDLDMGNHYIIHTANYTPSSNHHVVTKKYVDDKAKALRNELLMAD